MNRLLQGAALVSAVVAPLASRAADRVTTGSLVREMIDLSRLAALPDPAFETIQFSSYDRRSAVPGGPEWFSNADGFGREPIPGFEAVLKEPGPDGIGEYLVCDVSGPGAIVRCWTAAINGRIRVELDDVAPPVFDASADDFLRRPFDILAREVDVDPAVFDGTFNQQNATYCPIPFAKRCRIVWIGDLRGVHFYEVQIRRYAPGADVVTFSPDDRRASLDDIRQVAAVLARPGASLRPGPDVREVHAIDARIPAGETLDLLAIDDGPGAIAQLTLRAEAVDLDRALRQTLVHVLFDDAAQAQIQSPLGDLFGAAPGVNPFDSVPFTVTPDGSMTCRFLMPFATSMRVRVENMGDQEVGVTGSAVRVPYEWDDRSSMHFRARWRVDHGITADPGSPQDIPFLLAHGAGRYVGTASILLNPTDAPSPGGGWWGEGDEKIFVDDDDVPGTYGTGSEDYYNYAWSIPDIFGWAYCGQPRNDGPGNRGFVTNHRWHILDSLPFRERLAFYMELWPHRRVPGFAYARLSYHYGRPGMIDDHLPITRDDVRPLALPAEWRPVAVGGARNSVFIEAEDAVRPTGARPELDEVRGNLYSGGRLLVWSPASAGDRLELVVPVTSAGAYSLDLCALKSGESARVRLWIDDRSGEADATVVDLASPGRRILRRIATRRVELEPGDHTLHVQFLGEPGQVVGIDFVWIQKR